MPMHSNSRRHKAKDMTRNEKRVYTTQTQWYNMWQKASDH